MAPDSKMNVKSMSGDVPKVITFGGSLFGEDVVRDESDTTRFAIRSVIVRPFFPGLSSMAAFRTRLGAAAFDFLRLFSFANSVCSAPGML